MRRKDKEITDREEIESILTTAMTGRLGTCAHDIPYITPMNFVFEKETNKIFLHCANEGKKLENIRINQNVCFEVEEVSHVIIKQPTCASSVAYRSVVLLGKIKQLADLVEKNRALMIFADKYAPENPKDPFTDTMLRRTQVLEIEIQEITAKRSPAKPLFTVPTQK